MGWIALAGMGLVAAAAVLAARRQAAWRWCLAGAAGWIAAQGLKYLLLLPVLLTGGALGMARWEASVWFVPGAALLAGVAEELGKYVPLRWLRASSRGQALAVGLGAGAVEAIALAAGAAAAVAATGAAEPVAGALLAVWERAWAVATHAGLAMVDGVAVVRRQARWLLAAVGLHTVADLGAASYQHVVAAGLPRAAAVRALIGAEAWTALVAVGIWLVALRLWRAHIRSGWPGVGTSAGRGVSGPAPGASRG